MLLVFSRLLNDVFFAFCHRLHSKGKIWPVFGACWLEFVFWFSCFILSFICIYLRTHKGNLYYRLKITTLILGRYEGWIKYTLTWLWLSRKCNINMELRYHKLYSRHFFLFILTSPWHQLNERTLTHVQVLWWLTWDF